MALTTPMIPLVNYTPTAIVPVVLDYDNQNHDGQCRTSHGWEAPHFYRLYTCFLCIKYIITKHAELSERNSTYLVVVPRGVEHFPNGAEMIPDITNQKDVDRACSYMEGLECTRWKKCCRNAISCCDDQLSDVPRPYKEYGKTLCPRTWDGFHCFKDTQAGKKVDFGCPSYSAYTDDSDGDAEKLCSTDGNWYKLRGVNEWTNYSQCSPLDEFGKLHNTIVYSNIISIIFLVPACIIFCYFRPLRQQNRIRLHLCLMISALVNSVCRVLWYTIVFKDRLSFDKIEDTIMYQNSVACRALIITTRYTYVANFMWMFIEGFHLHRLLVDAFSAPKTLIPYYLLGVGFPLLPIASYIIIRSVNEKLNISCWVYSAGVFEWILYTPIFVALLCNVFFLLRILFIMVKQLAPHPNEPSNFRRAAKAVGVLVPLFGVQFILFVYRPEQSDFSKIYELTYAIVTGLQGSFIAILFCYINKEVQGHLKTVFLRVLRRGGYRGRDISMRGGSVTMTSQFSADGTRSRFANGNGDAGHMIPLQRISEHSDGDLDSPQNGPQVVKVCGPIAAHENHEVKRSLLDNTSAKA